ncbi:MAG: tetratricopeptide repeat protein [Candidatus Hydrogenedentota bacterium]
MRKSLIFLLSVFLVILDSCRTAPSIKTGHREFVKGHYHNAAQIYREYLEIRKISRNKEVAYFGLCWSEYFNGNDREALEVVNTLLTKYPKSVLKNNILSLKSLILFQLKDYKKSKEIIDEVLSMKNIETELSSVFMQELRFVRAEIHRREDNIDDAIDLFSNYINEYPEGERIKESYLSRALCYRSKREYDKALSSLDKLSEIKGSLGESVILLKSLVLIEKGDTDIAWSALSDFANNNPQSKWTGPILTQLSIKSEERGDTLSARDYYFKIIRNKGIDSKYISRALYYLGNFYEVGDRIDSAIIYYKEIENNYQNTLWFTNSVKLLYNLYLSKKRFDLSSDLAERYPHLIGEESRGYTLMDLARMQVKYQEDNFDKVQKFVEIGKNDEALELLEHLIEEGRIAEDVKAQALILSGNLLKKANRLEESVNRYFEAFLIAKTDKEKEVTLENLLTLYIKLGERDKAERTKLALEALRKTK